MSQPPAHLESPVSKLVSKRPPIVPVNVAMVVRMLLETIEQDTAREGLRETPDRVARFYQEFLTAPGAVVPMTLFDAEGMDQMIVSGGIPFYSLCEHHLLPFFGTATVGYVPGAHLVGLSKLPRIVQHFAHGLQNQERVTQQIADALVARAAPKGVGVVLVARHLCMEMRGVRVAGAMTTTSALRGCFLEDARCRREFLDFRGDT